MKKLLLFLMSVSVMLSSLTAVAEEYEEITVSEPEYDIVYPTGGISPEICGTELTKKVEESVRLFSNESDETLYECIKRQCMEHFEYVDVSKFNISCDDIESYLFQIFLEVAYTCPEVMVQTGIGAIAYNPSTNTVLTFKPIYLFESKEEDDKAREQMNKAVDEYIALAEPYSDKLEKLLFLHDEMVKRCKYNTAATEKDSNIPEAYHAYGIFVKETAVCQGYAIAFLELLNRIEIENRLCRSDKAYHIWNQVKIDGKWYNIDVTHDDPDYSNTYGALHKNFLASDSKIIANKGHDDGSDWEARGGTLTGCTDTEFESKYMFNYSSPFTIGYSDNEFNFDAVLSDSKTGDVYNVVFHSPKLRTPGMILSYDFKIGTQDYIAISTMCSNINDVGIYTSHFKDGIFCDYLYKSKEGCNGTGVFRLNKGGEGYETRVFFWNNATQAPYSYVYNVK